MQQRVLSSFRTELAAFLAANAGRAQRDDVGPWLGVAALIAEYPDPDDIVGADWQAAARAALDAAESMPPSTTPPRRVSRWHVVPAPRREGVTELRAPH
jgi:hypothetical protein